MYSGMVNYTWVTHEVFLKTPRQILRLYVKQATIAFFQIKFSHS